jgi:hypothetical protein
MRPASQLAKQLGHACTAFGLSLSQLDEVSMNASRLARRLGALLLMSATAAKAVNCPEPPKQATKDVQLDVEAAVGRIGPVKGGELVTKTRIITQDLLGKLPDASKLYLEQMLFSAYCSALRDDRSLSEGEKAIRLQAYAREVRGTIASASAGNPQLGRQNQADSNRALQARWKLAWVTINENYERGSWPGSPYQFDRATLLRIIKGVDVSMDKKLVASQESIVKQIVALPRAETPTGSGFDVEFTTRLASDFNEFKRQIQKRAILVGADIN